MMSDKLQLKQRMISESNARDATNRNNAIKTVKELHNFDRNIKKPLQQKHRLNPETSESES